MNIIIPLGGKGERFVKRGYTVPKPLISVLGKEMIRHVLDNLRTETDDTITILYHTSLDQHHFSDIIHEHYPMARLVPIPFQTRGAVETIDYGLRSIGAADMEDGRRCLLLDCDSFYTDDILSAARHHKNAVFCFLEDDAGQEQAKFSYISFDGGPRRITDIVEKSRISNYANTGAYLFEDAKTLLHHTQKVLEQDFRYCNEFYTSCVIKSMLIDGAFFKAIELPRHSFISLGTPEQLQDYVGNVL